MVDYKNKIIINFYGEVKFFVKYIIWFFMKGLLLFCKRVVRVFFFFYIYVICIGVVFLIDL